MSELGPNQIWWSGAYSPSRDVFIPHAVINAEYPQGRRTLDKRQAEIWANDDAEHFNNDPDSLATDWIPRVEIGEDIWSYGADDSVHDNPQ
jgi:hypothetical protein